jgi:hypothetical protein
LQRRGVRALALLVVALAACAPSPAPDAGSAVVDAGPTGAAAYCETIVDFFCPFYVRCGRMAVADVAACRAPFLESCEAKYEPTYVALEGAGLLTLSSTGVDACRAHLDDVPCADQPLDLDGPCAGMWVGTRPAGAACGFDVESFVCAPGTQCVLGLDLCGTCRTVVPLDEACGGETTCARDAVCSDGICAPRERTAPTYVDEGDPCDFERRCPYLTKCVDGFCARQALLDEACAEAPGCASGWCDDGTCAPFVAAGGACTASGQCRTACVDDACRGTPSACFDP